MCCWPAHVAQPASKCLPVCVDVVGAIHKHKNTTGQADDSKLSAVWSFTDEPRRNTGSTCSGCDSSQDLLAHVVPRVVLMTPGAFTDDTKVNPSAENVTCAVSNQWQPAQTFTEVPPIVLVVLPPSSRPPPAQIGAPCTDSSVSINRQRVRTAHAYSKANHQSSPRTVTTLTAACPCVYGYTHIQPPSLVSQ